MSAKQSGSYFYPSSRILIFGREPVLGQVKSRLEPELGAEGCLALYREMLSRILGTLRDSNLAPLELWVSSNPTHKLFLTYCNNKDIYLQKGKNLGKKMAYAVSKSLSSGQVDGLVIVGSDCPAMKEGYVADALYFLYCKRNKVDVVIGPALDGGYVLIALKRPHVRIFQDIEWGTGRVMEQTLARIAAGGLRYKLLEPLWDVDGPEDLKHLESVDPRLNFQLSV